MATVLRQWFGFSAPVTRRAYLATGLGLMALKYFVEAAVVYAFAGRVWTPFDYLNPSLERFTDLPAPGLAWAIAAWSIPFIWIGVSMTVRRALDAGLPAKFGLLFFVPVAEPHGDARPRGTAFARNLRPRRRRPHAATSATRAAAAPCAVHSSAVAVGTAIVAGSTAFSTLVMRSYGSVLFVGAPFVVGFVSAALFNSDAPRTMKATLGLAVAAITAAAGAVFVLALEGLLCLAMAFPLALVLALLGAALGRTITLRGQTARAQSLLLVIALPMLMGMASDGRAPVREVVSTVEIAAPPEAVWNNVIGFTNLAPPTEWEFRLGIAYPIRARIAGEGPGAVRRCEFSTGAFVEPITVWDRPRRLAFDVTQEPPGMKELSPYDDVHAPHVRGYLRSRRGEFRLVPLPNGGTRLEGRTFFTLAVFPGWYWSRYADAIIHRIHMRVLRHIKALSENG